ncbi:zinc ABC transporter permease subunit ZnuB [Aestuariicella hydrocarbonica]|uniref:High-affinity zinc uptake system membrane protein ZnuB n=1 Tax=Pseudomaricurvus hydrocarbonicus TaxID=1470433 RepID=A0A9E5MPB4_9GAMM|nr:zinc ABC transporter permease subunit ZnuB [Aestuariicella hydrocarbonica]NHO67961.1 zinc ABC transporter permease subunit ZnuB [Aestuariicella hydrocarbonica]
MPEFMWFALLAGCGVALMTGPLGSFAVWRRMAYFGDTLAHSALTGVAFGLILSVNVNLAVTVFCLLLALLLVVLQNNRTIATDTLLGILSHTMLALGLVVVSVFANGWVDLYGFLFGDLLATSASDLVNIAITAGIVLPLLIWLWRPLIAITVHEELAQVEGVPVAWVRTTLMLMMALVIAVAMKVVGVLLITALLIIPAAASRRLVKTPEQMAICASAIGMLAIAGGLAISFYWDTPAGPSAVLCASGFFALSLAKKPAL